MARNYSNYKAQLIVITLDTSSTEISFIICASVSDSHVVTMKDRLCMKRRI
jgi:hypothetical protein